MPNLLKMANLQSILTLHAQGRSQREIARTLGVDRGTVHKYLWRKLSGAKPAIAPTGSTPSKPATPGSDSKPAIAPIGAEARTDFLKTGPYAERSGPTGAAVRRASASRIATRSWPRRRTVYRRSGSIKT